MKKIIVILSILSASAGAYAFFGDLAKSVKSATSEIAGTSSTAAALQTKQEATLAKYMESKEDFLKAYAAISQACGADKVASDAKSALKQVESQAAKNLDVEEVAKLTDNVIAAAQSNGAMTLASNASESAKSACNDGLSYFEKALTKQLEVGKEVAGLAKDVKNIMDNGSTSDKIQAGTSLSPTVELARLIPSDISKSKDAIMSMVKTLKADGVNIPSSLMSVLGL